MQILGYRVFSKAESTGVKKMYRRNIFFGEML